MKQVKFVGRYVPVLSAKSVASEAFSDGKWIPHLVLDTSKSPDVAEYIRAHEFSKSGDAQTTWGILAADHGVITLHVVVSKPMTIDFTIGFKLERFFMIVDQAMQARCIFVQAGTPLLPELNLKQAAVSLEIGANGFERKWNQILLGHVKGLYRRAGRTSKEALQEARGHIDRWRAFGDSWPIGQSHEAD